METKNKLGRPNSTSIGMFLSEKPKTSAVFAFKGITKSDDSILVENNCWQIDIHS
jgi:hypothetical protein